MVTYGHFYFFARNTIDYTLCKCTSAATVHLFFSEKTSCFSLPFWTAFLLSGRTDRIDVYCTFSFNSDFRRTSFNLINFPVLRIITAVLFLLFDFLILLEIMELKFYKKYLLIFVPLIVVCTFLATQTPTMMVVWLFYLPRQIYRLAFCILFFVRLFCEKQKRVQQKLQHFSYVMLGVFLLNFSIFLEDTLLIFHIESFLTDMLSMTERNFSENALWCFISISIFIYCTHQMQLATKQKQQLAKEDFPGIPNKQPVNPMDRLPEIIAYYKLTPREAEILPLILQRKSSTAIAEELFISIGTVKTHTHNLYAKFHVNSKTELIHALFDFSKK